MRKFQKLFKKSNTFHGGYESCTRHFVVIILALCVFITKIHFSRKNSVSKISSIIFFSKVAHFQQRPRKVAEKRREIQIPISQPGIMILLAYSLNFNLFFYFLCAHFPAILPGIRGRRAWAYPAAAASLTTRARRRPDPCHRDAAPCTWGIDLWPLECLSYVDLWSLGSDLFWHMRKLRNVKDVPDTESRLEMAWSFRDPICFTGPINDNE